MQSEFVNPLTEPRWNSWILEHPDVTIFHTAQWARVLAECYGYRPQYAVFREAEKIVGILPIMEVRSLWTGRRGVSLPFSDECSPLMANGITLPSLIGEIRSFGMENKWDYLELRGCGDTALVGVQSDDFVAHHLTLDSSEEVQFSKLRDSTRRNMQKAIREGVEVHHLQTRRAVDLFYSLHCKTRRRHGLPPQPVRFFDLIREILLETGLGFVSLARFEKQWIAGAVYFRFGSQSVYKFGASDPSFQHLRANNLLMWEAIRGLRNAGATKLSLGRTDTHDAGLLQFKRGWGGVEIRLPYHRVGLRTQSGGRKPRIRNLDSAAGLSHQVVRRLPLSVLRLLGRVLYRHVG